MNSKPQKKFSDGLLRECKNVEAKVIAQKWPESFLPLSKFVNKFVNQFKEWGTSLSSQTFFFENVITNHVSGEDLINIQSRS